MRHSSTAECPLSPAIVALTPPHTLQKRVVPQPPGVLPECAQPSSSPGRRPTAFASPKVSTTARLKNTICLSPFSTTTRQGMESMN
jgi:hypothetical protein